MDVESIAVCLLNSFPKIRPTKQKILEIICEKEAPGISTSISYHVLPQIKEYERTSTTVTNAYVKPLTGRYLSQNCPVVSLSIGFKGKLFIMLSSGGVTSVETAAEFPVRIIESGPTAAVIAGQYYGKHFNIPEMFCFDMGGTTAKSCLIQKGVACGSHLRSWPGTKIYEGEAASPSRYRSLISWRSAQGRKYRKGKQIGHPSGGAGEFRCGTRTYLLRQRRH